ncbi:Os06g0204600 [Oryza sativa Japonica Group]|uniref:Os06g0204600 protein n=1 Tax=Oryza sativa subsp. japonica TaxID=39947 RepID=A0A0P0WU58_ORYSJ|nr:hypothetical protein EE612_032547 [Oryza sativa]BAS96686.1 Os06g0204600 [Oryza sativa Japonica Group]
MPWSIHLVFCCNCKACIFFYFSTGMENELTCRRTTSDHCHQKLNHGKGRNVQFDDLPEVCENFLARFIRSMELNLQAWGCDISILQDVICLIFSKLQLKDLVSTSVLSSKWKHMWTICPTLRFDSSTLCGSNMCSAEQFTQKFIDNVNAVLQQHRGKLVEALEIKIDFNSRLANHLNNWVSFAVSSKTKSLAFYLPQNYTSNEFRDRHDRYMFPFELLDGKAASCLQQIQLSFVSLKPPTQFSGFPKLKKLSLHLVQVIAKDLQGLLSSCSNLEWLSIVRCNLNDDELKVDCALSRLLYLRIANCEISKIEMYALKLKTFIYEGAQLPVDPIQAQELEVADIVFKGDITFQYALTVLPVVFPSVQNLTVHANFGLQVGLRKLRKSIMMTISYL